MIFYQRQHNAHVDAFRAFQKMENHKIDFVAAVASPKYAYARFRQNSVWVYHKDDKSPTGVLMACGMHDIDFAEKVIRRLQDNSPLSPTEGLNKSGAVACAY